MTPWKAAMTKDEFIQRFRFEMLAFMGESWAARQSSASELGMMMDGHMRKMKRLLGEMYDALVPKEGPLEPAANGKVRT